MNKKFQKRIDNWLRAHNKVSPHPCACGCKKQIILNEGHYKRGKIIPKFLPGHNKKVRPPAGGKKKPKNTSIWENLSEEEKQRRLDRLTPFGKLEENPNWKGGYYQDPIGYIHILAPDHPFNVNSYLLEHRLVVEEFLKENDPNNENLIIIEGERYLNPELVVHHKNEVKNDNRIENLCVLTPEEHCFFHSSSLSEDEKWEVIDSGKFR